MSTLSNELFAAARDDAPSDSLHDAMWDRVAGATGAAATAAGAQAASTTAKTFGAGKLLLLGGVIGAVSTALGVIVTLAIVAPSSGSAAPVRTPVGVAHGPHGEGRTLLASPTLRKGPVASAPTDGMGQATKVEKKEETATSDLAEEARLVTAARAALVAGDPQRALALVRATRTLSTRALEPEELGLEARALNALGRTDEAAATDLLLRRRYPDSALAR
jgi:hypothetical protein